MCSVFSHQQSQPANLIPHASHSTRLNFFSSEDDFVTKRANNDAIHGLRKTMAKH